LGDAAAWGFGISQGVLWTGRMVTELIFPIRVPLFSISNPTAVILPLVVLLALLFLVPLMMFRGELGRASDGK
jgi:hypothetical protein